jgi:hypothetical protein
MPINYNRQMQEWKLPKGNSHTYMQIYVDPIASTVVFFKGERASAEIVPFFQEHCEEIQDAGFCVWYLRVRNYRIEEFLADIGL